MSPPHTVSAARQPSGLALLSAVEMWERFSYYGMRAILVLFLTATLDRGGFGWSIAEASHLYGWYTGLVYLTPILGGYLADRHIGTHRAMVAGAIIIAAGHFSLAFGGLSTFYTGLALVCLGTGLFKPNVSTMVGQLYGSGDQRRDGGFTLFYMGINLGAMAGPLLCGWLAENARFGWHYGFAAAGFGMLAGLAGYLAGRRRWLHGIGERPAKPGPDHVAIPVAPLSREDRGRILAILITSFFVIFFWLAFEQAGSSMTIFAERSTDRSLPAALVSVLGIAKFPASWFQSVNPAFILLLAPLFSLFWQRQNRDGRSMDTPLKMTIGLLLLGSGFLVLVVGAHVSDRGVLVGPQWLAAAYFLHTCGELCVSPVGLAMVTRLAPLRFAAALMGVWFLANFAANLIGGYVAGALVPIAQGRYFHLLGGQADFFLVFVASSALAALLLGILRPTLRHLMAGADR